MVKTCNSRLRIIRFFALVAAVVFAAIALVSGCTYYKDSKSWLLGTIEKNYYFYDDFDTSGVEDLSLKEIGARLDKYSEYYTAEEFEAEMSDNEGHKSGIGLYTNFIDGKGIYVVQVVGNSPADMAGITMGDLLISGKRGEQVTKFETANNFSDFVLSNATGEKFVLSTAEKDFTVSREEYTSSYTYMATNKTAWEFTSTADGGLAPKENPAKARSYLPDDAAYINLSQFFGTAGGEMGALFEKFNAANKKSLILDLRNNGGGYVSVMQDIAGYFTSSLSSKSSVAMTCEYRNGRKQLWHAIKHTGNSLIPADTKVYVLANSGTASASEALIGVLVS